MADKITITIETGNSAFDDNEGAAVANMLRDLASQFKDAGDLTHMPTAGAMRDPNGNTCGSFKIEPA